jgi:hypothetical protein
MGQQVEISDRVLEAGGDKRGDRRNDNHHFIGRAARAERHPHRQADEHVTEKGQKKSWVDGSAAFAEAMASAVLPTSVMRWLAHATIISESPVKSSAPPTIIRHHSIMALQRSETHGASRDPFRITDQLDPARLEVVAERLETRGHHPFIPKPLSD